MLYLIHTFNKYWQQSHFLEWQWPKRRIFSSLVSILDSPLSLGIGGLRRCGKTTLLKQLVGHFCSKHQPKRSLYFQFDRDLLIKNANALENILNIYLIDILMYRKNKIVLYIGSSAIPLANARGSENFGSF